jgi:hypothetical protein
VLLGLRARRSRAERDRSGADPQRGVDHRRCPAGDLLPDALGTVTVAIAPDGFTGLPERERHEADRNQPQQDLAEKLIRQCFSAPEVSALLLSDALHAICAASQPIRRCTTP